MKSYPYSLLVAALFLLFTSTRGMAMQPTTDVTVPADFELTYQWVAGSMPPPYHYEYMIRLTAAGQGEMVLWPDYPGTGTPEWHEKFTLTATQVGELYQTLSVQGIFTRKWVARLMPPVGGSYDWLEVTANGHKVKTPSFVLPALEKPAEAAYASIRDSVPQSIRDGLQAKRDAYVKAAGNR